MGGVREECVAADHTGIRQAVIDRLNGD